MVVARSEQVSSTPAIPADFVAVREVRKQFGEATAVDGVSFGARRGELLTLLGPSGCGKTTTLRMVAGIESVDDGEILIDGEVVSSARQGVFLPPEKRNLGMVFQSYALWPHMTVSENVAYPLEVRHFPRREIQEKVQQALELVGLSAHAQKNATFLSGGQQQRVALARALVYNPKVLLLDEPLSNLDAQLRESMRTEIRALQQRVGVTAVYVTHDQAEAMAISDRVIVMNAGRIEQVGRPLDVYARPVNRFVASFMAAANLLDGAIREVDGEQALVEATIGGEPRALRARSQAGMRPADAVAVCVRPQHLELVAGHPGERRENQVDGLVDRVVPMGTHVEYRVGVGDQLLFCISTNDLRLAVGDPVTARFAPENGVCVRP